MTRLSEVDIGSGSSDDAQKRMLKVLTAHGDDDPGGGYVLGTRK